MTTEAEMKNLSLFTIGFVNEVDFTDLTNETVKKVNRIYDTSRDFVLSNYYWRFVMKRAILENPVQETDTFTADAGTEFITCATYNPFNGLKVRLTTTGTLPAGLALNTDYYTVASTGLTAQLSTTKGGSEVDITDAGTGTHTITFRDLTESPYKYLFSVPTDVLVLRKGFVDQQECTPIRNYEFTNTGFFTNDIQNSDNTVRFWYSADLVETEWPVYFVDYFKYKLALDLCFNLTGNTSREKILFDISEKMLLSSKNIDAKQVKSRTVKSSPFTDIRGN